MSDSSQGPGWWQDTDGKWYPPRPDAGDAGDGLEPTQPMAQQPGADEPVPGEPEELIIRPMSDSDVPPPPIEEPTTVMPVLPPTQPGVPPIAAAPTAATAAMYAQDEPVPPPWYREHWW